MRSAAEAVIEALLVADGEAGRFLIVERATRLPLMACLLQLGRAHNDARKRHSSTQLVKPLRGKRHRLSLLGKRGFNQTAGHAHIEFCTMARFELAHDFAHILDTFRADLCLDRFDRGTGFLFAQLLRQELLNHC